MWTARATTEAPASRSGAARARAPFQAARADDMRTIPAIRDAIRRVEGEYREMPGLSLTLPQVSRLWGMDRRTCELVLLHLIARRVLKRTIHGTYVRR